MFPSLPSIAFGKSLRGAFLWWQTPLLLRLDIAFLHYRYKLKLILHMVDQVYSVYRAPDSRRSHCHRK